MKISTRGRYALRFMMYLAKNSNGERVSLKDVADKEDISLKYLEHIVTNLAKEGMVSSARGPRGGYCLTKPASGYLITEILEAVEGDLSPITDEEIQKDASKYSFDLWKGLRDAIYNYLDSFTLDDLVSGKEIIS